jgi:hypothetical protein
MSVSFTPLKVVENRWEIVPGIESINVSNHNARDILAHLGLSPDFEEQKPLNLEAFEADCRTFLRLASGQEPDVERNEVVDGNTVVCGRRAGYLTARATSLLSLAETGLAAGATHLGLG